MTTSQTLQDLIAGAKGAIGNATLMQLEEIAQRSEKLGERISASLGMIALKPSDYLPYVNLGYYFKRSGQLDLAMEALDTVLGMAQKAGVADQVTSMAHTNKGAVYEAKKEFDNAIAEYRQAIKDDANNQMAPKYIARLKEQGRHGILIGLETGKPVTTWFYRE